MKKMDKLSKSRKSEIDSKIDIVINHICYKYNTSIETIKSKIKKGELVEPRYLIMYYVHLRFSPSLSGSYISGLVNRTHCDLAYCIKSINNRINTQRDFNTRYERLELELDVKLGFDKENKILSLSKKQIDMLQDIKVEKLNVDDFNKTIYQSIDLLHKIVTHNYKFTKIVNNGLFNVIEIGSKRYVEPEDYATLHNVSINTAYKWIRDKNLSTTKLLNKIIIEI